MRRHPLCRTLINSQQRKGRIAQIVFWHRRVRMASMMDICESGDGNNLWFIIALLGIVALNLLLSLATVCLVCMRGQHPHTPTRTPLGAAQPLDPRCSLRLGDGRHFRDFFLSMESACAYSTTGVPHLHPPPPYPRNLP